MTVRVPSPALVSPRRSSGFSLLEVSMALILLGTMSLGALQIQRFQQTVERGRQAGLRLAALRDGAQRYARDHGAGLLARTSTSREACEDTALSRQPSAGTPAPRDCERVLGGQLVHNAFQPSIRELQALGYLRLDDSLPFPHGNTIVDGRTGRVAEARWAVSLRCEKHCESKTAASIASGASNPAAGTPVLQLMLFNTQPFFTEAEPPFGHGAQLQAALQALGPGAMASLPRESPRAAGLLKGENMAPIPNPLRGAGPQTGTPGVLAVLQPVYLDGQPARGESCGGVVVGASGPGASGAVCRDGSAGPTARWDFNGQDLERVGRLSVLGNASVGGELRAGTVRIDRGLTIRHPFDNGVTPPGRVRPPLAVDVWGDTLVRHALIVGGHADFPPYDPYALGAIDLSGLLTVKNGFVDVTNTSENDSRQGGIRLPRRDPGQPCNAQGDDPGNSGGNIALHQPADGARVSLLVCNSMGRWVKAKGD